MQINFNTTVYSADQHAIGRVKEVIVDPRTRQITDLVVQHGLLFTDDRIIAASLISSVEPQQIILRVTAAELAQLARDYQDSHYIEASDAPASSATLRHCYWTAPPNASPSQIPPGLSQITLPPDIVIDADRVMLIAGSSVETSDDQLVGKVEQIHTDASGIITHLLIKRSGIYGEHKLVPVNWITEISDNLVRLAVDQAVFTTMASAS